jgi:hypothetical protein
MSGTVQKASILPPIDVAQSDEYESVSDDDVSMYSTEESSSTESTLSSINVPFDAHMLPGHGRRYSAVLPIICVADGEYIAPLLASVLYQRRVWGIHEPAVGIAFPKTGTVGQIFLGWLDPQSGDDRNLVSHPWLLFEWQVLILSLAHSTHSLCSSRLSDPSVSRNFRS